MGALNRVRSVASQVAGERRGGLPLALVIARYFVYVLVAGVVLAIVVFAGFMVLVSSGVVYAANCAEESVDGVEAALASGELAPEDLLSCFHWTVFDGEGRTVLSDMDEASQAAAWRAVQEGSSVVRYDGLNGAQMQKSVTLPDGDLCVLQYDYLPDFASRALRDALPNPQNLMSCILLALFVAAMALIAVRAARVIARKMRPLTEAASHIERQDLDFAVGMTNVREVNEVLVAMERMRGALEESLSARWAADEARRRQVSALAHDLKTPLSIARWNADLLGEGSLDDDQRSCSEGISDSIARMDAYVRLLVETSQADITQESASDVDVATLAEEVRLSARQLCEASGLELDFACTFDGSVRGRAVELARAATNLVANAVEHAPAGSAVSLRFERYGTMLRVTVEDEGPGFSAAALEHGKERFYTECGDRGSASGHYGLGLAIVDDIAAAHGGSFFIANREGAGACCVIEVPARERM